ncbi:MAG: transcriptional repressor [Alphaproteobacteria bacterium]|nr:transcriptional repressor [Alphaproteobacteria bacterium]MCV6599336.1 transcriptional repressor [Alphaproteobacteria bacterium]
MKNKYLSLLKNKNIRVTSQRLSILELMDVKNVHFTAEDVMQKLKNKNVVISLASVYNTLELFEKNNLIKKIDSDNGVAKYDGNTDFHLHLIDEEKDLIKDYFDNGIISFVKDFIESNNIEGFDIKDVNITIQGKFI